MNMTKATDKPTRAYRMAARADAAAETADRIIDAGRRAFSDALFDEVTLAAVAEDAGVTVQTVIRRFGSKEGLFEAIATREIDRVRADRTIEGRVEGDLPSAVHVLVAHYEKDGPMMLRFLAQEGRSPAVAIMLERARGLHEQWVRDNCADVLDGSDDGGLAAAVAATDLYVWKLLRLDRGMSARDVETTMLTLLRGLADSRGTN